MTTVTAERQSTDTSARQVVRPLVDIVESADEILLVVEMPGVDEKSADISLDKNILTIRGTASFSPPEGFEEVYTEWVPVDFERAFTVSDEISRDGIEATMKNGLLTLRLPKQAEAGTQKIRIKAE